MSIGLMQVYRIRHFIDRIFYRTRLNESLRATRVVPRVVKICIVRWNAASRRLLMLHAHYVERFIDKVRRKKLVLVEKDSDSATPAIFPTGRLECYFGICLSAE